MSDGYLYRIDLIGDLRAQRRTDPVLRGRLKTGREDYPHWQLREAHGAREEGEGVYALSFWKTREAMERNCSRTKGAVMQRIRADHPVLQAFRRESDQYLEADAWLYWATLPSNPDKPGWSPVGIAHADIDVWRPEGGWVPLESVADLRFGGEGNLSGLNGSCGGTNGSRSW